MKTMVCYIKVFYSERDLVADRLLAEEFVKYDRLPQYHAMFEKDGVGELIASIRNGLTKQTVVIPDGLYRISLANPSRGELSDLIKRFRNSGVNLPCVYPYFSSNDSLKFKKSKMKEVMNLVSD